MIERVSPRDAGDAEVAETTPAVECRRLTKVFGDRAVVDGVDLKLPQGCSFGFVGPNGAGKTTALSMLTGLLLPTSGSVHILGTELTPNSVAVKRLIGVVPDRFLLFERLRVVELLQWHGRIYGLEGSTLRDRVAELVDVLELAGAQKTPIGQYSQGMKKRVAFAAAVLHDPRVLFLDEPFEGLDPLSVRLVGANIEAMVRRDVTVFLTSHMLDLVERFCSRVAIINAGRIVWQGGREALHRAAANTTHEPRTPVLEQLLVQLTGHHQAVQVLSWLR